MRGNSRAGCHEPAIMSRAENLPQFLIIGAQKCGTGWLHACLRDHPQAFMPADKDQEIDFRQAHQLAVLQQRLAGRKEDQLAGDACAAWFWTRRGSDSLTGQQRNIVNEITDALSNEIKLIVMVRDPVQRAISGYLHHIQHGSLDPGVPILDASPDLGLLELSRYGYHLHNWLQRVADDNMIVLPAPAESATDEIFQSVLEFLRLDRSARLSATDRHVMPGLARLIREDGLWVRFDEEFMSNIHRQRKVAIKQIDEVSYARLISTEEINTVSTSLAEDTEWFLKQVRAHGWWHPAYAAWII